MSDVSCAIGVAQLEKVPRMLAMREHVAAAWMRLVPALLVRRWADQDDAGFILAAQVDRREQPDRRQRRRPGLTLKAPQLPGVEQGLGGGIDLPVEGGREAQGESAGLIRSSDRRQARAA